MKGAVSSLGGLSRCLRAPLMIGICCGTLFFATATAFVSRAGIQTDEALFAGPLCRSWRFFGLVLGHHNIPIMNMSYNGALKTWLYAPLLLVFRPTPAVVRKPADLLGAATIVLFALLLGTLRGRLSAWVGCALLATDTSFLLTTTYDWGPVALQHFLLVAAMFLALRWYRTGVNGWLAAAAFICGLAFWDKAVFVWVFVGTLAGLLVFASEIRSRMGGRTIALAVVALAAGGSPLLFYNLSGQQQLGTIRSTVGVRPDLTRARYVQKIEVLKSTLDGSALFGYLANEDWAPLPRPPRSRLERISFAIRDAFGEHRRSKMLLAYLGCLLLLPLIGLRRRSLKTAWFALVFILVSWVFMASTGGGGAAHHAILLWPIPQLFVAAVLSDALSASRRGKWVGCVVLLALCACNLLVTNQYLYQLTRDGSPTAWTDAIYSLADGLKQSGATQVLLPDWGMSDSLCLLTHDQPPMRLVDDSFLGREEPVPQKDDDIRTLLDPKAVWVMHVDGHEMSPGINGRILTRSRQAGFVPVAVRTYSDTNGRAIFQTFCFRHTAPK
jgi:4-amino-4-deoxy-L-arabinose transferase-like glycosyltransferase